MSNHCFICGLSIGFTFDPKDKNLLHKHFAEGFIGYCANGPFHINSKCHLKNDPIILDMINYIPPDIVWKNNKVMNINVDSCPINLQTFEEDPEMILVIGPCNHPINKVDFYNLIRESGKCPVCRAHKFIGESISVEVCGRTATSKVLPAHRTSSVELARYASLASHSPNYDEYDEKELKDIPIRNDSNHIKIKKKYLGEISNEDIQEVNEFDSIILPIIGDCFLQKTSPEGFNDLMVACLQKSGSGYKLIANGGYSDSVIHFHNSSIELNIDNFNLSLKHSGDPTEYYPRGLGGYCYGNNGERILHHRFGVFTNSNERISYVKVKPLDIPYCGEVKLTSCYENWLDVGKQFETVANEIEDEADIILLCAQVSYTMKTLRQLSTTTIEGHENIEPSCSLLTTTTSNKKEIRIFPWKNDATSKTIWCAILIKLN